MVTIDYSNQNYLFFNGGIEVDIIKIDTDVNMSFNDAIRQMENRRQTTTLFNTFNKNLYANYNPPTHVDALATITIYRQTPQQTYYDFICYLKQGKISFYDFNIKNGEYYHYLAVIPVPVVDSSQPSGIGMEYRIYQNRNTDESGSLTFHPAYWKTWSLTNIRESETVENTYEQYGYTWNLALNIESENITKNTSVTTWDTLGAYPKLSIGKKDYDSSTFTGLLGSVADYRKISEVKDEYGDITEKVTDTFGYTERFIYKSNRNSRNDTKQEIMNQYTGKKATKEEIKYATEMEKLKAWREFVNDGSLKLLKDLKGNSWIVQVIENPTYDIDNKPHSAPTTISFTWQEVENANNIAIINMD